MYIRNQEARFMGVPSMQVGPASQPKEGLSSVRGTEIKSLISHFFGRHGSDHEQRRSADNLIHGLLALCDDNITTTELGLKIDPDIVASAIRVWLMCDTADQYMVDQGARADTFRIARTIGHNAEDLELRLRNLCDERAEFLALRASQLKTGGTSGDSANFVSPSSFVVYAEGDRA
jgi:hypothetical protein